MVFDSGIRVRDRKKKKKEMVPQMPRKTRSHEGFPRRLGPLKKRMGPRTRTPMTKWTKMICVAGSNDERGLIATLVDANARADRVIKARPGVRNR